MYVHGISEPSPVPRFTLLPVTSAMPLLHDLLRNWGKSGDNSLGTCPTTVRLFKTATAVLSSILFDSLFNDNTSPMVGCHAS